MLNLIKNSFIEQQFDYCSELCQKLIRHLEEVGDKMEAHHCLLKVNAIRFRWLAKEQTMTINKQTKDLDAAKLATEYLEIYEKV